MKNLVLAFQNKILRIFACRRIDFAKISIMRNLGPEAIIGVNLA